MRTATDTLDTFKVNNWVLFNRQSAPLIGQASANLASDWLVLTEAHTAKSSHLPASVFPTSFKLKVLHILFRIIYFRNSSWWHGKCESHVTQWMTFSLWAKCGSLGRLNCSIYGKICSALLPFLWIWTGEKRQQFHTSNNRFCVAKDIFWGINLDTMFHVQWKL